MAPPLGSILLGTTDPQRLRDWYSTAFDVEPNVDGFLAFGDVGVLIDDRDDISANNPEPGRVILNFHVEDARAIADHLDRTGATWLVRVEERDFGMLFGTVIDPDGNYIQIIQLSDQYIESRKKATSNVG